MGVKRYVGSVKGLDNLYVELFFNQNEEIIGRGLYRKETFERLIGEEVTASMKAKLQKLKKSDVSFIRGEEFQRYLQARQEEKREIKEALDEPDFVYGDVLYNQEIYIVSRCEGMFANFILSSRNDNPFELLFFGEDELTYPDVVYFLRSSMKFGKVTFFVDPDAGHKDGIMTCLKSKEYLYVARLTNGTDIRQLRLFDENMKEVPLESVDSRAMLEKIQLGILQRNAKIILQADELVI